MPPRDPLTFPKGRVGFDSLASATAGTVKRPPIGLTQGGSSRKDNGAKPAATDGRQRPQKFK